MKEYITINPNLLKWARESAGYSIEEEKSKFPKIEDWEKGTSRPTYSQLEKLSEHYKRPIALFLFPNIPDEVPIEQSLRATSDEEVFSLSPKVRFLFRKAKTFQLYLKELYGDKYNEQIENISWLKKTSMNISSLATEIRNYLSIDIEVQKKFKSEEKALEEWRQVLATNGVYVFKDSFLDDKVSGFCVYDEAFPIIYLNNSTSKTRQIFTLFHELAHLLLKETFLDVYDNEYWSLEKELNSNTEWSCDKFAASFLVPDNDISKNLTDKSISMERIQDLAYLYKVSRHVILRKIWDLKLITKTQYFSYLQEIKSSNDNFKRNKKQQGNYYSTKFSYLGKSYFTLVFKKYYRNEINELKAAEYLDVKVKSFNVMVTKFLEKESNYVPI